MLEDENTTQELVQRLEKQLARQSFFQAVRMFLRASGTTLGRDLTPEEEAIRLRSDASEAYPASEIASIKFEPSQGTKPVLSASFFGLIGPNGALPHHYTQTVIDRIRHKDFALRDFLDIFNHRLLSLFYRAWEKHHFPVAYETAYEAETTDLLTECLMNLVGFGNAEVRNRLQVPDNAWLHFAGLKSLDGPRPDALQGMIHHQFRVPVVVKSFQGEWLRIPMNEQTQLGKSQLGKTNNNALGMDAIAGQQVWSVENRFRIELGPLRRAEFDRFTPDGPLLVPLSQFIRTYVGPQFDFDVQVKLHASDVPGTSVGMTSKSRLGWNTWVDSWRSPQPAEDAVFESEGLPVSTSS